jgi:hypothetical protein
MLVNATILSCSLILILIYLLFFTELAVKKYVGIGVGWASLITEHLLSHPFVVLRRQCQVSFIMTLLMQCQERARSG